MFFITTLLFLLMVVFASGHYLKPVIERTSLLRSRELIQQGLQLQHSVSLLYGEDETVIEPVVYHAKLELHAHRNRPISVLEYFEDLTKSIRCDSDGISLEFLDDSLAELALRKWVSEEEFVMITSHAQHGCGEQYDRTPYLVKDVDAASFPTVKLAARPIGWDETCERISVSLNHATPHEFNRELVRREDSSDSSNTDGERASRNFSLHSSIPDRVKLFPLPVSLPKGKKNDTSDDGNGLPHIVDTDFQVHCVGCSTDGKLLLQGAFDIDFHPFGSDGPFHLGKTNFLQATVVEDLKARVNLELFAGAAINYQFEHSLLPIPITITPFQLGTLLSIGPIFDFNIKLQLVSDTVSLNFTYGAEVTVPAGALARLDYASLNASTASGWDKAEINEIPFNINEISSQLSLMLNITASPVLTVGLLFLEGEVGTVDTGFSLDLPTLYANATEVTNVTSSCNAVGQTDYEYYPHAVEMKSGVSLALHAFSEAKTGDESPLAFSKGFDNVLLQKAFPAGDLCLTFGDPTRLGELKNTSDVKPSVDIPKLETAVEKDGGKLPSGIDPSLLAGLGPLPTTLAGLVNSNGGKRKDASVGARAHAGNNLILAAVVLVNVLVV